MTETQPTAPDLTDLLADSPSNCNWGKWGADDEVGSLNYLGPEQVLAAVSLVTSGKTFTLQRLIGDPKGDPVWPGRTPAERTQIFDESNWDEGAGGPAYPGRPIAQRGVVGRAVLLDMARFRSKATLDKGETFTHEDLLACAKAQGVEINKRDILILRTNFLQLLFEQGEAFYEGFNEPGLVYSPELVRWFQDMEIPSLVTDTIVNEVTTDPNNGVALVLHNALMRNLGVTLTEIADLEQLADDCADDGQYAFLYVAAPLKVATGSGSPVNPVVIK